MGLFKEIRLAKVTLKYFKEFCPVCVSKFRDVYKVSGDASVVSSYDLACDNCKLVIEKINKEVGLK